MQHLQNEQITLLREILNTTNTWLHFAEAKNAALIAFNVALTAAILSADFPKSSLPLAACALICLTLSTIAALWAFKPINHELKKRDLKKNIENPLHYAYIASLEPDEYLSLLYARYFGQTNVDLSQQSQLEKDYCEEIIENSRITLRKQYCFKVSFYIVLVMLIFFVGLIICA